MQRVETMASFTRYPIHEFVMENARPNAENHRNWRCNTASCPLAFRRASSTSSAAVVPTLSKKSSISTAWVESFLSNAEGSFFIAAALLNDICLHL